MFKFAIIQNNRLIVSPVLCKINCALVKIKINHKKLKLFCITTTQDDYFNASNVKFGKD